jgi:LysR family transcriptional regulator, low CO2-responsive transcriptional regulator
MNLKQLEVFLAVAETGSFSRGAEKTFLTQSTVSQHISSLETEFGIRLLDRTGRGALLTEAGKLLLRQARRVSTEVRETEQAMKRFCGIEDADLRIGASSIPSAYVIPPLLPLLLERNPGIRITVLQGDSREVLEMLAGEEVEAAITGSTTDDGRFESATFGRDSIRLIVRRDHPWANRDGVEPRELAAEPLVLREEGSGTGRAVTEALRKAGVAGSELTVRATLGSNEAVKKAIAAGAGIGFLSGLALEATDDLTPVVMNGLTISRNFHIVTRAGRELSPAAAAFASLLQELPQG